MGSEGISGATWGSFACGLTPARLEGYELLTFYRFNDLISAKMVG
jgi:hypothetical protein